MAKQIISYLKTRFLTGNKPNQSDYHDVFDSYVHKDEIEEINAAQIDARIANYDGALKEITPGTIDTLGDVLQVLGGFDTSDDLASMIAGVNGSILWENIQNKPGASGVLWNAQSISLDDRVSDGPDLVQPGQLMSKSVIRDYGKIGVNKKTVVLDLVVTKFKVPVIGSGSITESYATFIRSVTIGIDPWVNIQ